jgi:hypothetical protein
MTIAFRFAPSAQLPAITTGVSFEAALSSLRPAERDCFTQATVVLGNSGACYLGGSMRWPAYASEGLRIGSANPHLIHIFCGQFSPNAGKNFLARASDDALHKTIYY